MHWVLTQVGARAILAAGRGTADHVRAAIQEGSKGVQHRTIYAYTGWCRFADGWRFLHAGGALGPQGNDPGVGVELPGRLAHYHLPDPPVGADLRRAVQAVVRLLELAQPDRPYSAGLAAALVCAPARAVLGDALGSLWFEGQTGTFKTEVGGNVLMRFFGTEFHRTNAPGNWDSTITAINAHTFIAKYVILLIDDYRPPDHPARRAAYEEGANALLRTAADRYGRARGRPDGALAATNRYPRSLLLATGETLPPGSSALGRCLVLRFQGSSGNGEDTTKGTCDPEILGRSTAEASAGLYARALSGFIRWLAPRYEATRAALGATVVTYRNRLTERPELAGLHPRTPELIADFLVGFEVFTKFALDVGSLTAEAARAARVQVAEGLLAAATGQVEPQRGTDPCTQFLALLRESLTVGQSYLADARQQAPAAPPGDEVACGWRPDPAAPHRWNPHPGGRQVGWADAEAGKVYLLPAAAFAAAQELARKQGTSLPFDHQTLSRRLKDRGWLVESDRERNTKKKKHLGGQTQNVWALGIDQIIDQNGEEDGDGGTPF
jgi:hypothetical protein